eukprot:gnl/MRDRNA2_/MRDRNA2_71414_c0_seq1.p1 gnl/MRDRNA2_/MRDRNA2_71414_c0~~gnl/MRDRNA2_/MRDRNA2_71414_c0_seq1.p1  ORF type:complete len:653 (+),score=134.64 gnl/MRDRNA2_/MRDRNA2_71414_c0_seq1:46-2004(+)
MSTSTTSGGVAGTSKSGTAQQDALRRAAQQPSTDKAMVPTPPLPFSERDAPLPPTNGGGPPRLPMPPPEAGQSKPRRLSGSSFGKQRSVGRKPSIRRVSLASHDSYEEEGNYVERPKNIRQRMTLLLSKGLGSLAKGVKGIRKSLPAKRKSRASVYAQENEDELQRPSLDSTGSDQGPLVDEDPPTPDEEVALPNDEDIPCTMTEDQIDSAAETLRQAVLYNDVQQVIRLLRRLRNRGAVQQVLGSLNDQGETPAHCAARGGKVLIVQHLLEFRADPCKRDQNCDFGGDGLWPSEEDLKDGHMSKESADQIKYGDFHSGVKGKTVVYYMRNAGIFDQVFQKLFPGSKVTLVRSIAADIEQRREDPALVCAAKDGLDDLFKLLLDHVRLLPPQGRTKIRGGIGMIDCQSIRGAALYVACTYKNRRMVELLIRSKLPVLDLESRDSIGRTALYAAASSGDAHIVKMLVDAQANLQSYSEEGRLPLHEATMRGHSQVVKVLLDSGAEPNSRSRDAGKAFEGSRYVASADKTAARAGFLLQTDSSTTSGSTALQIADSAGNVECAQFLKAALQPGVTIKTLSGTVWTKGGSQDIVKNWPAQPTKPSNDRKGESMSTLRFPTGESFVEGSFEKMTDSFQVPAWRFENPANNLPRGSK